MVMGMRTPRLLLLVCVLVTVASCAPFTGGKQPAPPSAPPDHTNHGGGGMADPGAIDPFIRLATFGGSTPGSIRNVCGLSHRLSDDPIVFPNQPGASHSHDFFGNRSTDANSTYGSLRANVSSCDNPDNHSAYWVPTVYESGKALTPEIAKIYYRSDPVGLNKVQPFPPGLRMLAGNRNATVPQDSGISSWVCGHDNVYDPLGARLVPNCPSGKQLHLWMIFPECWDGTNLDSPNHQSHTAYSRNGICPATHPVKIPHLVMIVRYPSQGGSDITLASGAATGAHADVIFAWTPSVLAKLVGDCIRVGVDCKES